MPFSQEEIEEALRKIRIEYSSNVNIVPRFQSLEIRQGRETGSLLREAINTPKVSERKKVREPSRAGKGGVKRGKKLDKLKTIKE